MRCPGFAGLELRRSRAQDRRRRQVETEGVAVSWRPSRNPQGPLEGDPQERGRWVYEFTADNPGQLPIGDIVITISFTLGVERLHYDDSIDKLTKTLILTTPVLAGGKDRTWHRTLLINFKGGHAELENTSAVICFDDAEGVRHQNRWPKRKPAY
jgi:hypothetical protein